MQHVRHAQMHAAGAAKMIGAFGIDVTRGRSPRAVMGNCLPVAAAPASAVPAARRATPGSARQGSARQGGGSFRSNAEPRNGVKPDCLKCAKDCEYKWGDMQANQRRHWVWMPDEQRFMCRACFREHQEHKKRQQEERDKLRLAKMVKFGDKVSKPPALRRIDSGRDWQRTPSFQSALALTEATEVKLLVWEMTRQDKSRGGREGINGAVRPDAAASASGGGSAATPPEQTGSAPRGDGQPDDAAASTSGADAPPLPSFPKTAEQRARLGATLMRVMLFRQLSPAQHAAVVDAMFERRVVPGELIIRQGDEADFFYVVEDGDFDVFVSKPGTSGPGKHGKLVMSYVGGGTFGELAMLHGAPRAATVAARDSGSGGALWALGRDAFLHILVDVTRRQRRTYEAFLSTVPMLGELDPYDRSAMADCLLESTHGDGEAIIRQGDPGDAFYLLLEGNAAALVADESGVAREVLQYAAGMYFGEVALLRDEPRKATVVARGEVRVAKMERDAFRRLLANPLKASLDRQLASYSRPTDEKFVR